MCVGAYFGDRYGRTKPIVCIVCIVFSVCVLCVCVRELNMLVACDLIPRRSVYHSIQSIFVIVYTDISPSPYCHCKARSIIVTIFTVLHCRPRLGSSSRICIHVAFELCITKIIVERHSTFLKIVTVNSKGN